MTGAVLLLGIYTGFPRLFFANHLFETKDYTDSQLTNTLISLTTISLFVLVALVLFYAKVAEKKPKLLVRKVFFLFYLLFYFEIFKGSFYIQISAFVFQIFTKLITSISGRRYWFSF